MRKSVLWGMLLLGGLAVAAPVKKAAPLAPGGYGATLPAFVCGGCAEWVQGHLAKDKRLTGVAVDPASRALTFRVKPGAPVTAAELQKALDAAATQMGMGADYTMTELKARGR
ncbi:MAG: hypothetical protein E6Q99_00260 [Elusimicrobia bacterium]|nr:MAG: hypothetical protein E6Q99_00260 [Elusimicrobiota bacterium]